MIILAVLLIPLVSALAVHLVKKDNFSRSMPVIAGALNAALCGLMVTDAPVLQIAGTLTLAVDMEGLLLLAITDILFLLASLHLYSWQVLDKAGSAGHQGMKYSSFAALLLLFYFTMTLTAVVQDFGMLWVAVEATTLASAPLINFHRSKGSLEAMWKYLLICSIGMPPPTTQGRTYPCFCTAPIYFPTIWARWTDFSVCRLRQSGCWVLANTEKRRGRCPFALGRMKHKGGSSF